MNIIFKESDLISELHVLLVAKLTPQFADNGHQIMTRKIIPQIIVHHLNAILIRSSRITWLSCNNRKQK